MEAVRKALFNDFANWRIDNKRGVQGLDDRNALNKYMEEKYAMKVGEGNILDTIKGMNSPPVGETKKGNTAAVVSSLASCVKRNESRSEIEKDESIGTNTRMKRSAVEGKLATRTDHTK